MDKKRILYLDVLRVLACAMVVLMHTPHPEAGVPGIIQVPIYFLTAGGLVLFFMVSGALLLPTKMSTSQFLKRRIGKIAGPWLFWTLFYMAVEIPKESLSLSVVDKLFVMVSSPGAHVMWFMFVLLGLYLITPILSRFVQNASKKEVAFYLVLWVFTLAIPWLSPYTRLNLGISSPLYYFSGYVGYFLLGYYLHIYRPNIAKYAILLIAVPLVAKFIYTMMNGQRSYELFWYLSIPVMLLSVAYFSTIQKFFDRNNKLQLLKGNGGGQIIGNHQQLFLRNLSDSYIHHALFAMEGRFHSLWTGLDWSNDNDVDAHVNYKSCNYMGNILPALLRIHNRFHK